MKNKNKVPELKEYVDNLRDFALETYKGDPYVNNRNRVNVWSRYAVIAYLRRFTKNNGKKASLIDIGTVLNLDHSTVTHGINRNKQYYKVDKEYKELFDKFSELLCKQSSIHSA